MGTRRGHLLLHTGASLRNMCEPAWGGPGLLTPDRQQRASSRGRRAIHRNQQNTDFLYKGTLLLLSVGLGGVQGL